MKSPLQFSLQQWEFEFIEIHLQPIKKKDHLFF